MLKGFGVVKLKGDRPNLIGADLTLMPRGMTGATTRFGALGVGTGPSCAGLPVPTARFELLTTSVGLFNSRRRIRVAGQRE